MSGSDNTTEFLPIPKLSGKKRPMSMLTLSCPQVSPSPTTQMHSGTSIHLCPSIEDQEKIMNSQYPITIPVPEEQKRRMSVQIAGEWCEVYDGRILLFDEAKQIFEKLDMHCFDNRYLS